MANNIYTIIVIGYILTISCGEKNKSSSHFDSYVLDSIRYINENDELIFYTYVSNNDTAKNFLKFVNKKHIGDPKLVEYSKYPMETWNSLMFSDFRLCDSNDYVYYHNGYDYSTCGDTLWNFVRTCFYSNRRTILLSFTRSAGSTWNINDLSYLRLTLTDSIKGDTTVHFDLKNADIKEVHEIPDFRNFLY